MISYGENYIKYYDQQDTVIILNNGDYLQLQISHIENTASVNYFEDGEYHTYGMILNKGILSAEYSIINGKIDSLVTYYKNGKIEKSIGFSNGLIDGQFKYFNRNGKLVMTAECKNGRLDIFSAKYFTKNAERILFPINPFWYKFSHEDWVYYPPSSLFYGDFGEVILP